ncbi:UDP-glycosyltransferase UGT5 isoform X1 [Pieris rapae]|uniref:UDP-glycosyltransferase UGT5 isoform X1 n=2 Tax=Pieris rapae TaxID=64459 RepID=UPI001E27C027|nr:UDP-glycosyltransferase UGT5 isoform X1 [Pieris rapae]
MMMPKIYLLFILFGYCYGANILYVIPFSANSHYLSLRPIGLELARRGHNVTVITAHLETDHPPTYHQIKVDATKVWNLLDTGRPNVFSMVDLSAEEFHQKYLWPGTLLVTERALKSPAVQELLASDMKFDLVINEQFMQEAFNVLAYKYNAPLALVTTYGNCMKHNFLSRNPLQWETVTFELLDVDEPTSFFGRLRNMFFSIYEFVWWRFWFLHKQEELVAKYIPGLTKPVPSLYDIQRNTSLMLLNGHFSVDTSAAYLPNIVEVGGMHLTKSDKSLPQDLQKYLDDAVHGVVYINFGSNVQSTDLEGEKRQAFINVFKRLKQRIIFKWEEDTLEGKPDNVMIRKWLPQKEILAHPNIKVFISHGGLIGTQEAIYNGVPIIGIPVFSDQLNNILLLEEMGFGKLLKFHDITEERLYGLLKEVLEDQSYMAKAKEVSKRFKDRPMNALDTAMFWLEYVIRHNGAPFMKSPALQLNWFEYTMLDVYSFVVAVLTAIIYVIYKFISILIMLMCKKSKKIKRS